jgi:hypothetical protein
MYTIDICVPAVRHFTTSLQTSGVLKDKWTHINCTDGLFFFCIENGDLEVLDTEILFEKEMYDG